MNVENTGLYILSAIVCFVIIFPIALFVLSVIQDLYISLFWKDKEKVKEHFKRKKFPHVKPCTCEHQYKICKDRYRITHNGSIDRDTEGFIQCGVVQQHVRDCSSLFETHKNSK